MNPKVRFYTLAAALVPTSMVTAIGAMSSLLWDKSGRAFHANAKAWSRIFLGFGGVAKLTTTGAEHLDPDATYVFAANHSSMFDIPACVLGIPHGFVFVAKEELSKVPIWGWALKNGDYIVIDRSDRHKAMASMEKAAAKVQAGKSVLLYPEGTRSPDGAVQSFKGGALMLALKAGVPVVPITINGTFEILPKGKREVHPRPVELIIGAPIPTAGLTTRDRDALSDRVRDAVIAAHVPPPGVRDRPSSELAAEIAAERAAVRAARAKPAADPSTEPQA